MKSLPYQGPDPNKNFICNNGITIPLWNIITYNNNSNNQGSNALPEYVVYNTDQIHHCNFMN